MVSRSPASAHILPAVMQLPLGVRPQDLSILFLAFISSSCYSSAKQVYYVDDRHGENAACSLVYMSKLKR